ncbi:transcriptional regulator [Acetobacter okinawensis]|uniref:helix-turn-helix domain-containing protein n=1 Tax=Acetobacter okinawensis TaxID=1076594 RepID=UPI001BA563BE|nr:helix-turn-helix domain-containing protein [Acetobacter okinawensis]MBS0989756.1 transcriptional regulator [Acetobacter okinawensis]
MMDHLKIIHNEEEYNHALKEVEQYFISSPEVGTEEGDKFDLLILLIETYESKHHPIEYPDPVSAIRCRMDDRNLNQRELSCLTGISESKISEVLNFHRGLSLDMIRKLSTVLKIPTDVLVQEYPLLEAA